MGSNSTADANAEIDAWLRAGGCVVTASERAARALGAAYHRSRRAEGLTAWPAPHIQDWDGFLRTAWQQRCTDDRMVLSALQEQSLWADVVSRDGPRAALLEGPRHRVGQMAMDAHRLLCLYAPRFLQSHARPGWQQDAAVFSRWLAAFDEVCRTQQALSAVRLPVELAEKLKTEIDDRSPLLLAGFDRILPTQRALFDVWGTWREAPRNDPAEDVALYQATDEQAELTACALWCKHHLAANPHARLLIVTQDAAMRRGEIERTFSNFLIEESAQPSTYRGGASLFEFSLGVPLSQVTLARGAHLLLRWLTDAIEEPALDWLFSSEVTAANADESRSLTAFMRALRRRNLQRTRWRLGAFLNQRPGAMPGAALPGTWVARMMQARQLLNQATRAQRDAIEWAELTSGILRTAGWPGGRALSSAEFQVVRRWDRILNECASLGFSGQSMAWPDFLATLERASHETLFAPESQDAPILIAGPAESAGFTADATWFLGAHENAWPANGATHPLLPFDVQREAEMPHATAQLDWNLAAAVTARLLASAPQVRFSYSRQAEGVEAHASRVIAKITGKPVALPSQLCAPAVPDVKTVEFEDRSRIPFSVVHIEEGLIQGGSSVLTAQSQCPFKAFATARLGAEQWEPAEPALTAAQRGQLLHAVLHAVWSGPPRGIRSHAELVEIPDLRAFVEEHVSTVLRERMPAAARDEMPQRYLLLEEMRLVELVTAWLRYELTRIPFTVAETELDRNVAIHGLALKLRLDRVDRLANGTQLVIDYKSGNVSPTSWDLPRPDDVQLPLYAGFALDRETQELGGLVFAKVRAGQHGFAGRVLDARSQLLRDLGSQSALVKRPFTAEELIDWRDYIEKMAMDFIEGHAEVNPREYPRTCEHCGLEALCRIRENRTLADDDEDGEELDDA
jgi:ATP-dependent helicase/nuclease subunit B